ncbi:MAG: acetyl-CoA carboxylase biotin carboxylase subunit [Rhodospirillaceae bacterium]|jgi:acetyl-CoA carboxylase, biotin carboxylase subunit|nr:acetyl-CoA carboxylase biotin carboxylase subunit [Rhodospirillaceae bacterium]MBT6202798.1 acetyl-CoA carboxylase biotin carboxylase subunit [Rhodospirillaceae bacterium]MBT6509940.1 acetyl-CoA carboxylase biotin carboxylase subunit [Rhodospirillaceae bacterium]MBT7614988.1 acetyl-CoA carboxylase biotin carboxylase subunit [Rhodospirillaceae bacterium]
MFDKVLIANRGEIALRIQRACREMGIRTVAVHSEIDANAMHVRLADESVCIGPAPAHESYLNIPAIVSAAEISGAEAIHPGYGFLSENARFAEIVEEHGITFIGPRSEHIRLMGDKLAARDKAIELGLQIVPGSEGEVENADEAEVIAAEIGYPVLLKAAAGGGGRGITLVRDEADLRDAFTRTQREAEAGFGNGALYVEKFLERPRHIEIQVAGDLHGNVVHLGERDCSVQRRHQKVVEEAPSPALNAAQRAAIGDRVAQAMKKLGYSNVGTVEFLYENGEFYFIEMNTRLQVEHPVTEMTTGIDLVREQIQLASGAPLSFTQEDVRFSGHAIECRVTAENVETFAPSPGRIGTYHVPGGMSVRVDSALYAGYTVPPTYDSLIAKLVVHGRNRNECMMRLRRALEEFVIDGIDTTIPLHQALIANQDFANGDYDVKWLERLLDSDD